MYDIQILDETRNHLMMTILIINQSPGTVVKDLRFNISDSFPVELLRESSSTDRFDDIKLDFQLNFEETKEVEFTFKVSECSTSHKIRGTLSYKYQVRALLFSRFQFSLS